MLLEVSALVSCAEMHVSLYGDSINCMGIFGKVALRVITNDGSICGDLRSLET
jgi:hypothetical protein